MYGGENVIDGVWGGELSVVGGGVEYAEGFEVAEVLAVRSTELEVERYRICRERRRYGLAVGGEGWDGEGEGVKHASLVIEGFFKRVFCGRSVFSGG